MHELDEMLYNVFLEEEKAKAKVKAVKEQVKKNLAENPNLKLKTVHYVPPSWKVDVDSLKNTFTEHNVKFPQKYEKVSDVEAMERYFESKGMEIPTKKVYSDDIDTAKIVAENHGWPIDKKVARKGYVAKNSKWKDAKPPKVTF